MWVLVWNESSAGSHPIVLELIELVDGLQLQRIDADSGEVVQLLQDAGKRPCTPTAWLFIRRTVLQLRCMALDDALTRHACEMPPGRVLAQGKD